MLLWVLISAYSLSLRLFLPAAILSVLCVAVGCRFQTLAASTCAKIFRDVLASIERLKSHMKAAATELVRDGHPLPLDPSVRHMTC